MNINYKQPQFELFPANSATIEDVNKPKFLLANLTLSLESLVILSILGIMVALFSFSLGVEHGKHLTAQSMDERVAAAWNVGARKAAIVPAKPVLVAPVMPLQQRVMTPVTRNVLSMKTKVVSRPVENVTVKAPVAPVVTGHFTIQVATYASEEYARKDALDLKAKGFQSFLIKSGQFWLVCVGNYNTKDNAASFSKKLPSQFRSSPVRRI